MVSTREISIPGPRSPPSLMITGLAGRGHGAWRRPPPAVTLLRSPAHSRFSVSWEHAPGRRHLFWERTRKRAERKAGLKLTPCFCGDDGMRMVRIAIERGTELRFVCLGNKH